MILLTSERTSDDRLGLLVIVTPHRRSNEPFPGGSLILARCLLVAGAAGCESTWSRACRTAVEVVSTGLRGRA